MKTASALLLISAAFVAGTVVLAAQQGREPTPESGMQSQTIPQIALSLIGDDDEETGSLSLSISVADGDDDDEGDCDADDDEGDDCTSGVSGNAAKAGSVAPPQNGLFTNGSVPVVTSN